MLRVTGILIGSAIAVALLIVILGVPEFGSKDQEPVVWQEQPHDLLPADEPETETPEPETATVEAAEPEPEPEPILPTSIDEALVDAIFTPADERPLEALQENWYAFWSPFRSEIAAKGFVEQLQRTTGLDYRVVKQKPDVYEVAFAYADESDIEDKLATIAAATGLELPGG